MNFYAKAAQYAELGVPVVPVQEKSKACTLPNWQNLATDDLKQIKIWNEENPNYNVGVVAKNDGILILDCDVRGMIKRIEAETGRKLPATLIVKSGKGMAHLYFRQTDVSRKLGNRNAVNPEGGEFFSLRQHNRYVVGAGSLHPNGNTYTIHQQAEIAPFPDWLAPWVAQYSEPENPRPDHGQTPVHDDFDFDDFIEHYGIETYGNGPWFITPICPVKGDKHQQSKYTGFYYDGSTLGFHCFAAGCGNPSIGDVIRTLNEDHEPYRGPIWVEEEEIDLDDPKWSIEDCSEESPVDVSPETEVAESAPVTPEELGAVLGAAISEQSAAVEATPEKTEAPVTELPAEVDPLAFPEDALYGRLGQLAKDTQCPLGFAYPAMLTVGAAHGPTDISGNVRGSMYVVLVGGVGSGKSVAKKRALETLHLPEFTVTHVTPGSDRGLIKMLGKHGRNTLLVQDEFRNTLNKCNYQGSSLAPVMCDLWSEDIAGAADKKGVEECDAKLSILGCLACEDNIEFSAAFGSTTTKGLSDRFVIGIAPPLKYEPVKITEDIVEIKPCHVPAWCYEQKHTWVGGAKERRRLGEIGLRVALITSVLNGDPEVTPECMKAALRFCDWQIAVREKYKPGIAENKDAECMEAIVSVLHDHAAKHGLSERIHWARTMNGKSYYRRFGAIIMNRVKKALIAEGIIVEVYEEDDDGKKKKASPYVRLAGKIK